MGSGRDLFSSGLTFTSEHTREFGKSTYTDIYGQANIHSSSSDPVLKNVLISGPTLAESPDVANPFWNTWGPQVAGNNTIPDQYAWHYEIGGRYELVTVQNFSESVLTYHSSSDPDISDSLFHKFLAAYKLPFRPVNINEYATLEEETPSGYAWWISRLERYNYAGLLGLWNPPLYDNFANLLTKSPGDPKDPKNTNYVPAAGFNLYKYYVNSMRGPRAKTTGSPNREFDTFTTIGNRGDKVRILAGSRATTGNYTIQISGLQSVGYKATDTLNADYYAYYGSDNIFDPYPNDAPFLGVQSVPIVRGVASLNVYVPDKHTGWRIEFTRK